MIQYSKQIPPIYFKCKRAFGVTWDRGCIITYGDTVYCKFDISEDYKIHEATHVLQQQSAGVELWWEKYFADPQFRLLQEVEAYGNQIIWAKEHYNQWDYERVVRESIKAISSSGYGNICTKDEAMQLLCV